MQRRERDAGGVALLEGGDAARVIATEAVAHDGNALGIDVRALRQPVIGRTARHLVVVAAVDAARPQTLALPRAVERERVHAAPREFEPGKEDAHLLAVVHAVDDHHGRGAARHRSLHEQGRQGGALVGHLDTLDIGITQPDAGVIAAEGALAGSALLGAGPQKALGVVEIIAGAQIIVARRVLVAGLLGLDRLALDERPHGAPFLEPRVRLVLAKLQPLAHAVHLLQRHDAVGRHALDDESRVRPQKVVAEMVDPRAACRHGDSFFCERSGRRASRPGRCATEHLQSDGASRGDSEIIIPA